MASYQDYKKMLQDYYAAQGPAPTEPYFDPQAEVSGYGQAPGYADKQKAYQDYMSKTGDGWLNSLTPAQRTEYDKYHQQAVDANAKKARMGAIIALGAPLMAAGVGAALGPAGFGSLGTAGEAAASGGSLFNAAADSQLASTLAGITGSDAAGAASIPAWAQGAAGAGWTGGVAPALAGAAAAGGGAAIGGGTAGGAGLLGSIGSALGGAAKGIGAIGAVAGGLLGATQKSPTDTLTKTIDPRMANYLYGADGNGGMLGGAYDLWKKQMATGGLNATQSEGLNSQLAALRSPAYTQGYDAMRKTGLGLLNGPVAGNPFLKG